MLQAVNQNLTRFDELRAIDIPNDVSPPFHFSALVPGMTVNRTKQPFRMSTPGVKRPANLEDVAFWPVAISRELIKTKQVTSIELTEMYLDAAAPLQREAQLRRHLSWTTSRWSRRSRPTRRSRAGSTKARCTAFRGAPRTSSRSRATRRRGVPARSRIRCSTTTRASSRCCATPAPCWSPSSRPERLAQGDRWFGGQTKSPWDPSQGSERIVSGPGFGDRRRPRRLRDRHRDQRIDSRPVGALRRHRSAADARAHQPRRRDGALVDAGSARTDVPLRRRLRACDERHRASRQSRHERRRSAVQLERADGHQEAARRLSQGGVRREHRRHGQGSASSRPRCARRARLSNLVPVDVPEFTTDVSAINVESATFFDEFMRSGRDQQLTNPGRASGWKGARVAAGARLPAVAAHPHDDDDEARRGDGARRCLSRAGQRWRRRGRRPRRPGWWRRAGRRRTWREPASRPRPAAQRDGESRDVSGGVGAERFQRRRHADEHHVFRAPVRRVRAAGSREGVSGCDRVPSEASDAGDVDEGSPNRAGMTSSRPARSTHTSLRSSSCSPDQSEWWVTERPLSDPDSPQALAPPPRVYRP